MQRTIKSYVLRAGRMSPRQQMGLEQWLPQYLLPAPPVCWNFAECFGRTADVVVEIGFGMGASLIAMAQAEPAVNFVGIEVHRAGIGAITADLHELQLKNVRIAPYDAVEVFNYSIADATLAGIQIFFPDPWPKKRHQKRRLVQPKFIHQLTQKIKRGGYIHCATDWQDYAEQMHAILSTETQLTNQDPAGGYVTRPERRPLTKFEQRGHRLGHGVWDLMFLRNLGC